MSTKLVFDTSALISLSLAESLHLDALAIARGWKQSVIYGTAILMMEKAREAKGEK